MPEEIRELKDDIVKIWDEYDGTDIFGGLASELSKTYHKSIPSPELEKKIEEILSKYYNFIACDLTDIPKGTPMLNKNEAKEQLLSLLSQKEELSLIIPKPCKEIPTCNPENCTNTDCAIYDILDNRRIQLSHDKETRE